MIGRTLTDALARKLDENPPSSACLDTKTSYDFIYEAACEWVRRTCLMKGSQTITTITNKKTYNLSPDYFFLYWKDDQNRFVATYNNGNNFLITFRDYDAILRATTYSTTSSTPYNFTLSDGQSGASVITGTVTSNSVMSAGECNLIDTENANFTTATVAVGDEVQNTTDGSSGVVLEITSTTTLAVALFGGRLNYWTDGDTYIIIPQPRKQLLLNSAPLNAGETITLYYIQKPTPPVYAEHRSYRIDNIYTSALVSYAAWLYRYRDMQPNYGDGWYKHFELQARSAAKDAGMAMGRNSFRVNFMKRSNRDHSYR